ncbi:MAG: hypothetical protein U1F54_16685 [Burkholderiales bacterium]
MDQGDAYGQIRSQVNVSRQQVIIAKSIVLRSAGAITGWEGLVNAVLKANDVVRPTMIVVHQSVDPAPDIKMAVLWLSWQMATAEAIWSLIHSGQLLYGANNGVAMLPTGIGWTTIAPGVGSGTSSGWDFKDFSIPIPASVRKPPSVLGHNEYWLMDPDAYIHTLAVDGMDANVRESLEEAVRCFRTELYTAAMAMLGKSSEGAWLELGEAFLRASPAAAFVKQRVLLGDPMIGPGKKIDAVLQMATERKDAFGVAFEKSGVGLQQLRLAAQWSDTVRDSRNTIHFRVEPATPNSYDKVATLLLAAVNNLRSVYALKAALEDLSTTN